MKRIAALFFVLCTVLFLCACDGSDGFGPKSKEDLVRESVEIRGKIEYLGTKIGGKEMTSSSVNIKTVREVSDTEYYVAGKITMSDDYGNNWTNNFDCHVVYDADSDTWDVEDFETPTSGWSRG